MSAFKVDDDEFSTVPLTEDPKVGHLLYEIEDKEIKCDCLIEWVGLQFYEHLLVIRSKERHCCCPPTYFAEAIPRFKILNVTFTNGRRGLWRWGLFLFIVGLVLLIMGIYILPGPGRATLLTLGIITMLVAILMLFLRRRWRYVTIDVKGNGGGRWFSRAKTYIVRFRRANQPDEGFIFNYVFGPLSQEFAPFHALSHLHEASLAHPLTYENSKREPWFHFDEEEQTFGIIHAGQMTSKLKSPAAATTDNTPKTDPAAAKGPSVETTKRPSPNMTEEEYPNKNATEANPIYPEEQHQHEHSGRHQHSKEKRHHKHRHQRGVDDADDV